MIRLASGADIPAAGESEALLRIRALYRAYGDGCAFLRFFTDDAGALLSVMDGFAVLHAPRGVNDEWLYFLSMQEEIRIVRTVPAVAERLARQWNVPYKTGKVMRFAGEYTLPTADLLPPDPRRHYALLCRSFDTMPPFDSWYVDVSHRLRHGMAHIASVMQEGEPVSTAMTVAETETAVLLGAVATGAARRGACRSVCADACFAVPRAGDLSLAGG